MARIVGVETFFSGDVALVRVRTEDGHEGWGQVAPYHADITALVLHRQVAPHVLGQDDGDLIALGERVMEREHKFPGSHAFEVAGREQTVQHAWSSRCGRRGRRRRAHASAGHGDAQRRGFVSEQVIRGCYFGSAHLQRDVPALVGDYLAGNLLLDELITRRIGLEELNDAFDALRAGEGARSVLVLE
jgi:Zn-dependent alcohol dehydrogenase